MVLKYNYIHMQVNFHFLVVFESFIPLQKITFFNTAEFSRKINNALNYEEISVPKEIPTFNTTNKIKFKIKGVTVTL